MQSTQSVDFSTTLGILEPIPTGWNTPVDNPGDNPLSDAEQEFKIELARRQGGQKNIVQVSQGADLNISPDYVYSEGEK